MNLTAIGASLVAVLAALVLAALVSHAAAATACEWQIVNSLDLDPAAVADQDGTPVTICVQAGE